MPNRFDQELVVLKNDKITMKFDPHTRLIWEFDLTRFKGNAEHEVGHWVIDGDQGHIVEHTFPLKSIININDGIDIDVANVVFEMDKLIKPIVAEAIKISDHESFEKSPAWYMFLACILNKKYAKKVGFKCSNYLRSELNEPYFSGPALTTRSLSMVYYLYSKNRLFFYNAKGEQLENPAGLDGKELITLSKAHGDFPYDKFHEFASFWGLPVVNPS